MHISFYLQGSCESSQGLLGPNGGNTTPRKSLVQFGDLIHNTKRVVKQMLSACAD